MDGTPTPRTLAPDLARGLMLLLIAVANSTWYLWGHAAGAASLHPTDGGPLDTALQAIIITAVDARIYPLFSFLFGYGMVQFANSRAARGLDDGAIRRMLRRRHWAMVLFGAVHAALLYVGDILGAYGLIALVLVWLLFRRSEQIHVLVAGLLVGFSAMSALATLGMGGLMVMFRDQIPTEDLEAASAFDIGTMRDLATGEPHYPLSVLYRLVGWGFATPMMIFSLVIPAAIILGWIAARRRLLEDAAQHRALLGRVAAGGIAVGWLGGLPSALAHVGVLDLSVAPWATTGIASVTGLAGGLGYAALFALLAARVRTPGPGVRAVAAVGKRSLSAYLLQSIVMAPLLAAWGLGLGARMNTAGVVAIAAGAWLLSGVLAGVLERSGRRGPFEVLLRRLTYGSLDRPAS